MNAKYEYGAVICDMHDGLELPDGVIPVSRIEIEAPGGSAFIQRTLEFKTGQPWSYLNKTLVIIDTRGVLDMLAYSYDDRRFGLIAVTGLLEALNA